MLGVCRACGVEITPENVARTTAQKDGKPRIRTQCKACRNTEARNRYKANPKEKEHRLLRNRADRKKNPAVSILQRVRDRARASGIEFALTVSDILPLPTHCPVLNIPLCYDARHKPSPDCASVDRVDNDKGYIPGNVVVVSNRANVLKRDATVEELLLISIFYSNLKAQNGR